MGYKTKPFDAELVLWKDDETVRTAATYDSAAVDLQGDDLDQENPPEVFLSIADDFAAQATTTLTISLIDCDTVGGSYAAITPICPTSAAIAKAGLEGVRTEFSLSIPRIGTRQFIKLRIIVGTADVTAGKFTAYVSK